MKTTAQELRSDYFKDTENPTEEGFRWWVSSCIEENWKDGYVEMHIEDGEDFIMAEEEYQKIWE
jgi:hypothetical protein